MDIILFNKNATLTAQLAQKGYNMTNTSQLNRLQIGAIRQLGRGQVQIESRLETQDEKIERLTKENVALAAQLKQIEQRKDV